MIKVYVKHTSWWKGLFRRHEGTVENPYRTLRQALRYLRGTVIDKHVSIILSESDEVTRLDDSAARGLSRKI